MRLKLRSDEVRNRSLEVFKLEVMKLEIRSDEVRSRKLEVLKSEVRSRKLEVGSWESEVRSYK